MRFVNLNGFTFDPLEGMPDLPDGLVFGHSDAQGLGYYIVQFDGPIMKGMKEDLSATGATILSYVSYNAFVVRADGDVIGLAEDLPCVRWIGMFEPAYKLSPRLAEEYDGVVDEYERNALGGTSALARAITEDRLDGLRSMITGRSPVDMIREPARRTVSVEVSVFEEWNLPLVLEAVASLGGQGIIYSHQSSGVIRAEMDRGRLTDLAHELGVMWIDRHVQNFIYNDIARWVVQSGDDIDFATPVHDHGIWGTGQVVTVCDSGIDYEHDAFEDPSVSTPGDTHRKVTAYYVPEGAWGDGYDEDINHGTHTSGTVAGDDGVWHVYDGDSLGSNGTYGPHDGQAFDATLQVQDLSPDGYGVYPPSDMRTMYQEALDRGSWIHTNSWGGFGADYITESMQTDDFVWDNQDFLVVFAAGNNGAYTGAMNPFAVSKNVIAVGATGNGASRDDVAYFSSRGPASDGRLKPDVMAPGVGTWSALGGDPEGQTDAYVQYSGTSMATPTVAGSCALIRQYYMDGWYPTGSPQAGNMFTPSAALIKATVINSAVEVTGSGAYDNGEYWYPNNSQGWGQTTLDDALYFDGDLRGLVAYDERMGLSTGETAAYLLAIGDASMPVEITLVWTDYPGSVYSTPNLVNDLDLVVTGPDGTTYIGNQFEGYDQGESVKNPGEYDRLNNVENVLVLTGLEAGVWTIEVTAHNVPVGPQPYALVATGGIASEKGVISMDSNHYQSDALVTIRVADTGLDLNPESPDTAYALLSSSTEEDPETVMLTETGEATSVFEGTIVLELRMAPISDDGVLQVQNMDVINATYYDEDDGLGGAGWVTDMALVDDDAPVVSGVAVTDLRARTCKVSWDTDELSDSTIWYGTEVPPALSKSSTSMTLSHVISLTQLLENTTYYFSIESTDYAGNTGSDDNGSDYFSFRTPDLPPMEPLSEEWPTFQNNMARLGLSPSEIEPPLEEIWSVRCFDDFVLITTPILSEGVLVSYDPDGSLRAWDPYTGDALWETRLGQMTYFPGTPTAAGGAVYACAYNTEIGSHVVAVDIHTGETLWKTNLQNYSYQSVCLGYHDGVLFGTTHYGTYAMNGADGTLLWEHEEHGSDNGVAVANGLVYAVSEAEEVAYATDEYTGEVIWVTELGNDYFAGPPCVCADTVYVVSYGGIVHALDAFSGEEMWTVSGLGYILELGAPVCDGSMLYVGTYDSICALDAFDGAIVWDVPADIGLNAMSLANGYLYCAVAYDGLVILNPSDGSTLYSYHFDDLVASTPVISDNLVWVQDYAGTIHCFVGLVPTGLQVSPSFQAQVTTPGNVVRFDVSVENTGYLGDDTFDISVTPGTSGWVTLLLAADGETPLEDTDGDDLIDTGPLAPYENTTVVVLVEAPSETVAGDSDTTVLTFTSSNNMEKHKNSTVSVTVPLPGTSIGPSAYTAAEAGESITAVMEVSNEGGMPDIIDIETTSHSGWQVSVFGSDGVTPLTDSDDDDILDVGELAGLESVTITVELLIPEEAGTGDFERVIVTARSSTDPGASDDASVVAELPLDASGDWPTFGHDAGRGAANPVDYELPLSLRWSYEPDDSYSTCTSPVISDGTVYYASMDGHLTALDISTGEEVWKTLLGYSGTMPGTPTVSDGFVYVTSTTYDGAATIIAFDQVTGVLRWSYESEPYGEYVQSSTPAVALGRVYWTASNSGRILANDATTGEFLWSHDDAGGSTRMGPTYWGGMVFCTGHDGRVIALDAISGEVVWIKSGIPSTGAPVVSENVLYVQDSYGILWAIDPLDGTTVWSYYYGGYSYCLSPAVAEGMVFIAYTSYYDYFGHMLAVDCDTGEAVWDYYAQYASLTSSPAFNNGTVFSMDEYDVILGWDASTGERVVTYDTQSGSESTVAIGGGHLVVTFYYGVVQAYGFKGAGVAAAATAVPDPLILGVGQSGAIELEVTDVYGLPARGAAFEWESLNGLGSVLPATVDGQTIAYVAGLIAGTDTLRYSSDGLEGTVTVEILPGSAASVIINPAELTLEAGATAQFSATVKDAFGNIRGDAEITWTASASAGAIGSDGTLVASTVVGTGIVTAESGGISATAAVAITPGPLAAMTTDPESASVTVGSSMVVDAVALDEFGNAISGLSMTWSCTDGSVYPIGDDGASAVFVAPTAPGEAEVTVSVGDIDATMSVDVEAGALSRIVLTPDDVSVRTGDSIDILASWEDVYGNDLDEQEMDWECTIGSLTVAADGLSVEFHAGSSSGEGEVSVSYGSTTGSATVTVTGSTLVTTGEAMVLAAVIIGAAILVAAYLLLMKGRKDQPGQKEQPPPPA